MTNANDFNAAWAKALAGTTTTKDELPPDGLYTIRVTEAAPFKSKAGNPCLRFEGTITVGEFRGRKIKWVVALTEKTAWAVVANVEGLGLAAPEDPRDLPTVIVQAIDKLVMVEVKTGKQTRDDGSPYRNVMAKGEVAPLSAVETTHVGVRPVAVEAGGQTYTDTMANFGAVPLPEDSGPSASRNVAEDDELPF